MRTRRVSVVRLARPLLTISTIKSRVCSRDWAISLCGGLREDAGVKGKIFFLFSGLASSLLESGRVVNTDVRERNRNKARRDSYRTVSADKDKDHLCIEDINGWSYVVGERTLLVSKQQQNGRPPARLRRRRRTRTELKIKLSLLYHIGGVCIYWGFANCYCGIV